MGAHRRAGMKEGAASPYVWVILAASVLLTLLPGALAKQHQRPVIRGVGSMPIVRLPGGGGLEESSSGEGSSETDEALPDDLALAGDRVLSPDEVAAIPEELLIPAPPPPRYSVDYADEYPDMCVRRTVRKQGTAFRASAEYWGKLDTFGLNKAGERRTDRNANWDERSRLAVQFVSPGATVLDLGCGPLMQVRDLLPPNCTYLPSDVVPRTPDPQDTYICDINGGLYPKVTAPDVVMALGVAEYINDPVFFLTSVSRLYAPARFVLTYVVRSRLYQKHDQLFLTKDYILRIMEKNGYRLIKIQNTVAGQARQHLFVWDYVGKEAMEQGGVETGVKVAVSMHRRGSPNAHPRPRRHPADDWSWVAMLMLVGIFLLAGGGSFYTWARSPAAGLERQQDAALARPFLVADSKAERSV